MKSFRVNIGVDIEFDNKQAKTNNGIVTNGQYASIGQKYIT